MIIKLIKKYLLLQDQKLEKKWWHRLVKVLIYSTSIFILIALLITLTVDSNWTKYEYGPFHFELGYNEAKGKNVECEIETYSYRETADIKCNHRNIDESIFVESFFLNDWLTEKKFNYDEYLNEKEHSNNRYYDSEILKPIYEKYFQNNKITAKENIKIQYSKIAESIFIPILIAFLWLLFWSIFIYQSTLYIIFGKNKK